MVLATTVEPHLFVVFGGTGDLMRRKLLPALARLNELELLGEGFKILGVSRRSMDDTAFREWAREALAEADVSSDPARSRWCDQCLHFQSIGQGQETDYRALKDRVEELEGPGARPRNRVFYLAMPPSGFAPSIVGLGDAGLNQSSGWTRLVIEKPFGRDLASAQDLNRLVHRYFEESQIYRIDHYLGKETVQNLLVFRFANPLFESVWNRDRVESIEITVAEELGVGERAGYYDKTGALRDMVQNHLTQLLTLTAMEVPAAFEADTIRDEKVKVLRSLAPLQPDHVVFAQYSGGIVDGEPVPSYLQEPGVDQESRTETLVSIRLEVLNWRWQGIPFILRTGKRLAERLTQIKVRFRSPPVTLFRGSGSNQLPSGALVITLQPDEGFDLDLDVKSPGPEISLDRHSLKFRYAESLGSLPEAYETLLLDVLTADQTLFVRGDEVEAAWRLYAPVLDRPLPIRTYPAGSWGPEQSDPLG